jgi:hypothetical protein
LCWKAVEAIERRGMNRIEVAHAFGVRLFFGEALREASKGR